MAGPGAPPATLPTLTEEERRAIARCAAISRFQKSGVDMLVVSIDQPADLVPAMRRFQSALDKALEELEPRACVEVEPLARIVLAVVPELDLRAPELLIAQFNGVMESSIPVLTQALRALSVSCPSAMPPSAIDQASAFRLGMQLPPGMDPVSAFT